MPSYSGGELMDTVNAIIYICIYKKGYLSYELLNPFVGCHDLVSSHFVAKDLLILMKSRSVAYSNSITPSYEHVV